MARVLIWNVGPNEKILITAMRVALQDPRLLTWENQDQVVRSQRSSSDPNLELPVMRYLALHSVPKRNTHLYISFQRQRPVDVCR